MLEKKKDGPSSANIANQVTGDEGNNVAVKHPEEQNGPAEAVPMAAEPVLSKPPKRKYTRTIKQQPSQQQQSETPQLADGNCPAATNDNESETAVDNAEERDDTTKDDERPDVCIVAEEAGKQNSGRKQKSVYKKVVYYKPRGFNRQRLDHGRGDIGSRVGKWRRNVRHESDTESDSSDSYADSSGYDSYSSAESYQSYRKTRKRKQSFLPDKRKRIRSPRKVTRQSPPRRSVVKTQTSALSFI